MKPPVNLPDYEMLKVLGRGSHGLVYLARELKSDRFVAVKEFPVSRESAQRFFRELSILFTLEHPNVLKCLNLIQGQGNRNHLVFEYADGGTLREFLEQNAPFEPKSALEILRPITAGLAHIHDRRVIHRDLKPENILVCRTDDGPVFKIGDVGIAARLDDECDESASVGSPAYMSPEQFYDAASPRSDLYSLGVLLFEMLTGRLPFSGMPSQLFAAHVNEPPDLDMIADAGCRSLAADLLAKKPEDRPSSARRVLSRINRLLDRSLVSRVLEIPRDEATTPIEFGRDEVVFTLAGSKSVPGSGQVFAASEGFAPVLLLADSFGTDLYEPRTDRFVPHFLGEGARAVAPARTSRGPAFVAGTRFLYSLEPGTGVARRLFNHQVKVGQLVHDEPNERLIFADALHVYCATTDGRRLWREACRNYFLQPQVCVAASGDVYVGSGPADPKLHCFDREGRGRFSIRLDSPLLAVASDDESEGVKVVLSGLGTDRPASLATFVGGEKTSEIELASRVHSARFHGDLLTLFQSPSQILVVGKNGRIAGEIQVDGEPLSDCRLVEANKYFVLVKNGHRRYLNTFVPTRREAGSRAA